MRGIHGSPVNSPHKGQWRGALIFSFISAWINGWIINREAGDLRRHRSHYDVIVMNCVASGVPDDDLAIVCARNFAGTELNKFGSHMCDRLTLDGQTAKNWNAGLLRSNVVWSWWRHPMKTFSALLVVCAGNSSVNGEFSHKGQWRGALLFSLICAWINGWVNNRDAGDLRRHRAHYNVTVMCT